MFVSKLSPTADSLIGSTYFDGDRIDISQDISTDLQGHIYITGTTGSYSFPTTPNVFPSALNGFTDSFVSIFSADLAHLIVSYYLGGSKMKLVFLFPSDQMVRYIRQGRLFLLIFQ